MNIVEMREKIKLCDETKEYLFVSYSKENADKVYPIVLELQNMGINIWIDKNLEDQAGKSWQEKAFSAIKNGFCEKILFFMSKESFFSLPVCSELIYTLNEAVKYNHFDKKVEVIPFSIDESGNIGKVIEKCREDKTRCNAPIGEKAFKDIFINCLNENEHKMFTASTNQGAVIAYVFKKVFDDNSEINVVSDTPSIIKNIPKYMLSKNNSDSIEMKDAEIKINNNGNKTQAQDKPQEETIGNYVRTKVVKMLGEYSLTEDEINKLLDKDYSNKTFGLKYPFLCKDKESTIISGGSRYYANPVKINGKDYYITNDWYKDKFEKLKNWVETIESK